MPNPLENKIQENWSVKNHDISKREYDAVHAWLRRNFGKANKCEGELCAKNSQTFEWALIKGNRYERKRENFVMLCRSCHCKYDFTEEGKKRLSEINKGKKLSPEHLAKLIKSKTGIVVSQYTREKIRKSSIGKKMSDEARQKMSLTRTGQMKSKETKLRMRLAHLGKKYKTKKYSNSRSLITTAITKTQE